MECLHLNKKNKKQGRSDLELIIYVCIYVSLHSTTAVKNQASTHNLHCMYVVNVFTITLNV